MPLKEKFQYPNTYTYELVIIFNPELHKLAGNIKAKNYHRTQWEKNQIHLNDN